MVREIRFCFWASCQSQFWARKEKGGVLEVVEFEGVGDVQDRAVQPSEARPKLISVRTFMAMMSMGSTLAPAARPVV